MNIARDSKVQRFQVYNLGTWLPYIPSCSVIQPSHSPWLKSDLQRSHEACVQFQILIVPFGMYIIVGSCFLSVVELLRYVSTMEPPTRFLLPGTSSSRAASCISKKKGRQAIDLLPHIRTHELNIRIFDH